MQKCIRAGNMLGIWGMTLIIAASVLLSFVVYKSAVAQLQNPSDHEKEVCKDFPMVQLANDTNVRLETSACGNIGKYLDTNSTSHIDFDIEAVWGIKRDFSIAPFRLNSNLFNNRSYRVIHPSGAPPAYLYLDPCATCTWQSPNPDKYGKNADPAYRLMIDLCGNGIFEGGCDHFPNFVLYAIPEDSESMRAPFWDRLGNTTLDLSSSQKSKLSAIYVRDYHSMLLTNTVSGRQRCIWYSLHNINLDQFPGGNSSMGLKNNIDRIQTFGDNTCGGADSNQDGIVDSQACSAMVSASAVSANTVANNSCGTNPNPDPGTTPSNPPPSNPQNPSGRLILYTEKYYVNPYYELETGAWDIENRQYRSISIPGGWSFVLEDSSGKQSCFNQSLHNLTDHSEWEFNIDGIYVFSYNVCQSNGGNPEPEPLGDWFVRLWTKKNYDGSSLQVKFTGDERYFWFPSVRLDDWNFNDDFESMELNEQRSIALYEHDDLQGGGKCFYDNDRDFSNDQFSNGKSVANRVSSFRFFVGDTCTLKPLTPQDMWVHAADKTKVILTWPRSSPNADGFYVYRIDQNGNATRVAQLTNDQAKQNAAVLGLDQYIRSWTFTDVTCDGSYTFAVSAYSDNGESGRTRQVTANTPQCDCNDRNYSGVGLYDQRYCQGDNIVLNVPGWYYLTQFDNRASSVFVKPGWSVEVLDKSNNAEGATICFNESKWDLSFDKYWIHDYVIDGTVSTVRVWDVPNCGRTLPITGCDAVQTNSVTLFDHTHCLGIDKSFSSTGFYELSDFDDLTSSVFVPAGKSARLYVNRNKGGNYVCVKDTKWDMNHDPYWWDNTQNTFNNVSAVEVFNDAFCGGAVVPVVTSPTPNAQLSDLDVVTFSWQNSYAGGYWGELWGPNGYFQSSGHLTQNQWYIGALEPGNYTFRILSEVFGEPSVWSDELHFTVVDSNPAPEMTATYNRDTKIPNRVTFTTSNCTGEWVHVEFGHDNLTTDSPCTNGTSSTQHDYPYWGDEVSYNAVVGGVSITVNLPRLKDCGELKPSSGVSLFAEKDCRGEQRDFSQVGKYQLATYNDQASAILVAPNWSVEVFEHSNSSDGNAYCVTRDIWDLSYESYYATEGYKLDNTISNIRVYNDSACGKEFPQYGGCDANIVFNGVVLFDYKHCGGSEQKFDKAGKFELGYGGSFNDLASSAHIDEGWSIQVFSESGWRGEQVCLHTTDKWDFGVDKYWNSQKFVDNSVSSVEVFHNASCTADTPVPTKPNAPTNLQPTGGTFEINSMQKFSWQGEGDSYIVTFTLGDGSITLTTTTNSLMFGAPEIGEYVWHVKAVKDGLESDWSQQATFTTKKTEVPNLTKPSAPTNLRTTAIAKTSFSLVWNDNSNNEEGFSIQQWDGQSFEEVARVAANVIMYDVRNMTCNTAYRFKLAAFNSAGQTPSNEVSVKTAACDSSSVNEFIYLPVVQR